MTHEQVRWHSELVRSFMQSSLWPQAPTHHWQWQDGDSCSAPFRTTFQTTTKKCKEKSTVNMLKATKMFGLFLSFYCCCECQHTLLFPWQKLTQGPLTQALITGYFFHSSHVVKNFWRNVTQDTIPGQKSLHALLWINDKKNPKYKLLLYVATGVSGFLLLLPINLSYSVCETLI